MDHNQVQPSLIFDFHTMLCVTFASSWTWSHWERTWTLWLGFFTTTPIVSHLLLHRVSFTTHLIHSQSQYHPWVTELITIQERCNSELRSLNFLNIAFFWFFFFLQDVLKKAIGSLEKFFKDIKTCHLPLNPALCIKGVDRDVSQLI